MRPVSYIHQRRTISTSGVPRQVRTASARRHPSSWPIGARSQAANHAAAEAAAEAAAADARLEREQEIATVKGLMARSGSARPPLLGAPTRCPDCEAWGFVAEARPGGHRHACRACGAEWVITARALLAVQAELDDDARVIDLDPLTVWTPPPATVSTPAPAPAASVAADRVIDLAAARKFRAWGTGQPAALGN